MVKTDLKYDDYKQYEISNKIISDCSIGMGLISYYHTFKFENGYGASVIKRLFSYGYEQDLFELAVLKFTGDDWEICYDTPIADEVIAYLTNAEVLELLEQIKQL